MIVALVNKCRNTTRNRKTFIVMRIQLKTVDFGLKGNQESKKNLSFSTLQQLEKVSGKYVKRPITSKQANFLIRVSRPSAAPAAKESKAYSLLLQSKLLKVTKPHH